MESFLPTISAQRRFYRGKHVIVFCATSGYIPSSFGRRLVKTGRLKIAVNILLLAAGCFFPEDF